MFNAVNQRITLPCALVLNPVACHQPNLAGLNIVFFSDLLFPRSISLIDSFLFYHTSQSTDTSAPFFPYKPTNNSTSNAPFRAAKFSACNATIRWVYITFASFDMSNFQLENYFDCISSLFCQSPLVFHYNLYPLYLSSSSSLFLASLLSFF